MYVVYLHERLLVSRVAAYCEKIWKQVYNVKYSPVPHNVNKAAWTVKSTSVSSYEQIYMFPFEQIISFKTIICKTIHATHV